VTATRPNSLRLVVFMEPARKEKFKRSGRFCSEREYSAARIGKFCRKKHLPYGEKFVCAAILAPRESICDCPARIYGSHYVLLKNSESVLRSIGMVARDDLLQLLTNMATRFEQNAPDDSLRRKVRDLRERNTRQKLTDLLWATKEHGTHGYSEARLSRCITWEDVASCGKCD